MNKQQIEALSAEEKGALLVEEVKEKIGGQANWDKVRAALPAEVPEWAIAAAFVRTVESGAEIESIDQLLLRLHIELIKLALGLGEEWPSGSPLGASSSDRLQSRGLSSLEKYYDEVRFSKQPDRQGNQPRCPCYR